MSDLEAQLLEIAASSGTSSLREASASTQRENDERFRLLVEEVSDYAIYLLDTRGNVVSWNIGAEHLKGYQADEIIGQHYSRFFTDQDQLDDKPQHLLTVVESEGRTEAEGWRVRKDGSRFWANVIITALRNTDGSLYGFAKITRDLAQRKQAEDQIRTLHRTLGVLSDINQAIVRIRHMPTLFEQACQIAVEKGAFSMAWVGLLDPTTQRVKPVSQAGLTEGVLEASTIVLGGELHGRSAAARTLRAGVHVVCSDIAHDSRTTRWRADALRMGYHASAAFPLQVAGEVRGTLNLYTSDTEFFDDAELRLLDEMAGDLSLA
ncbi:MAG: PAS domain S-box protein, partial [Chloroflexota bacterium]